MSQVAGLVLAAGAGRRIGGPKALLRLEGRLLVDRAAQVLVHAGCDPVVVVLGAQAETVAAQAALDGVVVVVNPGWEAGMGSSLRVGLRALASGDAEAAMVILVDQPGITVEAARRVKAYAGADALASASYSGRRSHPVLFGRNHWAGILEFATGDVGARPYLQAHADHLDVVACEDVADDADVDTPDVARAGGIA